MTIDTKAAAFALSLTGAAGAFDWRWAMAMGLGLLGGWLARVGLSIESGKTLQEIWRDLLVSLLIAGGSILATLTFARMMAADELGVGAIGFAVALSGSKAITMLRDKVLAPLFDAAGREPKP